MLSNIVAFLIMVISLTQALPTDGAIVPLVELGFALSRGTDMDFTRELRRPAASEDRDAQRGVAICAVPTVPQRVRLK